MKILSFKKYFSDLLPVPDTQYGYSSNSSVQFSKYNTDI